jgi:hypothetical protein
MRNHCHIGGWLLLAEGVVICQTYRLKFKIHRAQARAGSSPAAGTTEDRWQNPDPEILVMSGLNRFQ